MNMKQLNLYQNKNFHMLRVKMLRNFVNEENVSQFLISFFIAVFLGLDYLWIITRLSIEFM